LRHASDIADDYRIHSAPLKDSSPRRRLHWRCKPILESGLAAAPGLRRHDFAMVLF
jgi:hypothetical protein